MYAAPAWPRPTTLFICLGQLALAAFGAAEDRDCSLSLLQVGVRSVHHLSGRSRSLLLAVASESEEASSDDALAAEDSLAADDRELSNISMRSNATSRSNTSEAWWYIGGAANTYASTLSLTTPQIINESPSVNFTLSNASFEPKPPPFSACHVAEPPESGFDREGGDLLARPVAGGVDACVDRCCNTAGCVAYVFAEAPSSYGMCVEGGDCCYMKSAVTEKRKSTYVKVATGLVQRPPAVGGPPADWPASNSSIHDVVGEGGVFKITLDYRPEWEKREKGHVSSEGEERGYQNRTLDAAGIRPTAFRATDVFSATAEDIRSGCPLETEPETAAFCQEHKKDGTGCKSRVESAIADSHRRALSAALERNESDWTLIMEDDVVPMNSKQWSASFQDAWKHMDPQYKMIRMGWCTFEEDLGPIRKASDVNHTGKFQLNNWMSWTDKDGGDHYYSGGCTSAYMVHREIIPELLSLFPCCCPLDCCFEHGLYYMPTNEPNLFRGQQVVMNMDTNNTAENTRHFTFFNQSGVLVQDNRQMRSTRPEFNRSATTLLEVPVHRNRSVFMEETEEGLLVATTTL